MAETTETTAVNTDAGHLAVHFDGIHTPGPSFSFEQPQSTVRVGAFATHILVVAGLILYATYGPMPSALSPASPDRLPTNIVWLDQKGPGGGGGGGGNKMPEPPKKAEVPGKQAISVPVTRPETPKPEPKPEEPPDPLLNIPAKTLGDTAQLNPGLLESAMAASMISQGTGTGGGGGTGRGTGIGSGDGSGLGAGSGGGTGGGVYRPGNGVELPRVIQEIRPQYTADAMRAKVQGTVWVECVVLPDGTVGEANVTKSLDSVFGLDQEALKAAKRWRFIPGRRLGQPVPVLVTIELTFTLR
jgi:periplasmic protein TonB